MLIDILIKRNLIALKHKTDAIMMYYCEIVFILWTFNFVYFVSRTLPEFNLPIKYYFILVIFHII